MRPGIAAVVALVVLLAGSSAGAQSVDRRTGGGAALAALGSSFSGRVVSVADGDTLDVMTRDTDLVRMPIRLNVAAALGCRAGARTRAGRLARVSLTRSMRPSHDA